jgi:hypothetical protein
VHDYTIRRKLSGWRGWRADDRVAGWFPIGGNSYHRGLLGVRSSVLAVAVVWPRRIGSRLISVKIQNAVPTR